MSQPKYPAIRVKLGTRAGNKAAILSHICGAMMRHDVPRDERQTFLAEARAGDYDHTMQTCTTWVRVS